ncbi:hypothetical protein ACIBF5_00525 [Micromonospora sp. NPDC050417]|uniref:hypothetical protein n=1 Tax=Micromonospora sp. NPDC050417 TaxID=3364280 RepID=UPI00378EE228
MRGQPLSRFLDELPEQGTGEEWRLQVIATPIVAGSTECLEWLGQAVAAAEPTS